MNNSQFRAIPKTNDFTIPFELEEDALLDWLHKLSRYDSQEACLQVLRLLQALQKEKMGATQRISFLSTISVYLKGYINQLEGICWDAGFPLSIQEKVYAEAVTWNYLTLCKGFFVAAQDTNKKEAAFALGSALRSIAKAQLHIAAVYSIAGEGFWKVIYKMYAMADKKNLLDLKIKEFNSLTLDAMFKKLFIFQACDTNQFRARDMQTIFHFLDDVCNNMPITNKADQDQASFVFYLDSDEPPVNNRKNDDNAAKTARYFSPIIVAYEIYEILKKGELWSGTLKSINKALFLRVIKTLSQGQKRKYTRLDEGYDAQGVVGFDNIIHFLRQNKSFSVPKLNDQDEDVQGEPSAKIEDLTINDSHQLGSVSGDNYVEFDYHESDSAIWQNEKDEEDNHEVSIETIHVYDSSAKGYSVYWDDSEIKAKIGDVFGLISDNQQRLEVALIRRIAMNINDDFRFGAEVIGFESEIVYICHPKHDDNCTWAIFIPGIKALKQTDTLIFSMGSFRAGHHIFIHKDEQKIKATLVKELHSTSGIVMVELAYPNPKEAPPLKNPHQTEASV